MVAGPMLQSAALVSGDCSSGGINPRTAVFDENSRAFRKHHGCVLF